MRKHPRLERFTRPVKPNHCIVGCEAQLLGSLRHWSAFDDNSPKDPGVFRLELLGLNQDAPAVDVVGIQRRKLEFINWRHGYLPPPKFIHQHIAGNSTDPGFGSLGVV